VIAKERPAAVPACEPIAAPDDYFHQFLHRTILMLGRQAVDTLRGKTVAIAGCGGQGGAACLTLARMGVGGFHLADPKPFDEPDINRQWAASRATLGRNKARVYEEMLLAINPDIRVRSFCEGLTDANVEGFVDGADMLIDCLDISVAPGLRARMFAAARGRGIYAATGAMISFGGIITVASPDGLPMELAGGQEEESIRDAKLPPFLEEVFVPELVRRIEKTIASFRAPSLAVSPALLGLLLSTEAVVALLGATIPGWRPPVCLPNLLLVDPLRMTYRVAHIEEFLKPPPAPSIAPVDVQVTRPATEDAIRARRAILSKVGGNTNLLPHQGVQVDLLTDSWSEIPLPAEGGDDAQVSANQPPSHGQIEDFLRGLTGYRYVVPVFRGRFAESLLARTLPSAGIVVCNSLFPTTRFHLASAGLEVRELAPAAAFDGQDTHPFKGDLDLPALEDLLASIEGKQVRGVYLELSVNAIGGHPISLANLQAIRCLTAGRGIRILLDPTRAFENAALIQQREDGYADRPLPAIVRELCSCSDGCAASLTKDFRCAAGGFIGTHDLETFIRVRDLTLAYGDGLAEKDFVAMRHALSRYEQWNRQSQQRVQQVQRLHAALRARSVPVINPPGGHGIFVDVRALLPHVGDDAYPAQTLANELFALSGVRAAENLITPLQAAKGVRLLRLAVPIGACGEQALQTVLDGLTELTAAAPKLRGLRRTGGPPGVLGQFTATYAGR